MVLCSHCSIGLDTIQPGLTPENEPRKVVWFLKELVCPLPGLASCCSIHNVHQVAIMSLPVPLLWVRDYYFFSVPPLPSLLLNLLLWVPFIDFFFFSKWKIGWEGTSGFSPRHYINIQLPYEDP